MYVHSTQYTQVLLTVKGVYTGVPTVSVVCMWTAVSIWGFQQKSISPKRNGTRRRDTPAVVLWIKLLHHYYRTGMWLHTYIYRKTHIHIHSNTKTHSCWVGRSRRVEWWVANTLLNPWRFSIDETTPGSPSMCVHSPPKARRRRTWRTEKSSWVIQRQKKIYMEQISNICKWVQLPKVLRPLQ